MPPQPSTFSNINEFTLLLPAGLVTFTLPPPPPSSPKSKLTTTTGSLTRERISIPPNSPWSPSPHWHEHYTEYVRVIQGKLRVTIGGEISVKAPEDGVVTFEKYVIHDFCRADQGPEARKGKDVDGGDGEGEVVIVEEWTEPEDDFKQIFFRNVMASFADPALGSTTSTTPPKMTLPLILQLLTTIPYVDNYVDPLPFLSNGPGPLSPFVFGLKWMVTHFLYVLGSFLGRAAGYQAWRREYTPEGLWGVAERGVWPYRDESGRRKVE